MKYVIKFVPDDCCLSLTMSIAIQLGFYLFMSDIVCGVYHDRSSVFYRSVLIWFRCCLWCCITCVRLESLNANPIIYCVLNNIWTQVEDFPGVKCVPTSPLVLATDFPKVMVLMLFNFVGHCSSLLLRVSWCIVVLYNYVVSFSIVLSSWGRELFFFFFFFFFLVFVIS